LLYVDPESPLRDYAAARRLFVRLVTRYPQSAWTREARAWQATLAELLRQEAEAARLHGDMQRLKELDLEMEGR
jgi:TolA-binding protein